MTTLFSTGILGFFSPLFIFIAAWALLYAIMEYAAVFGKEKQGLRALLAFVSAALLVSTRFGIRFLEFFIPWALIIAIATFFIILVFRVFGITDADIVSAGKSSAARTWIIILLVLVLFFGVFRAFTPEQPDLGIPVQQATNTSAWQQNPYAQPAPPGSLYPPGYYAPNQPRTNDPDLQTPEDPLEGGTFGNTFADVITHPKVLGMLLTLLVAVFAIMFLTSGAKK
ncbi:MAG: hypothetical protein HC945_02950 [Nitrosarchaeum sp.]|nr:hypothetical protein [Nitrosarchaeum sp.]